MSKLRSAIEFAQKAVGTVEAAVGGVVGHVEDGASGALSGLSASANGLFAQASQAVGGAFGRQSQSLQAGFQSADQDVRNNASQLGGELADKGLGFGALGTLAAYLTAPGADGSGGAGSALAAAAAGGSYLGGFAASVRGMLAPRGYQPVAGADSEVAPAPMQQQQAYGLAAQPSHYGAPAPVGGYYYPPPPGQPYPGYAPLPYGFPGGYPAPYPAPGAVGGSGGGAGGGGGGSGGGAAPDLGPDGEPKTMNPYQIFKLYASKDNEGLDYSGFCRLLDHLEIQLIGDKRREQFARFTPKGQLSMGYKEFEACYDLIKEMIVLKTLADNGMTRGRFIILLCYAVFVLLLIFVFIFVGVAAFTGAGTLGAIINSLLAAGSGIALNLKKKDETEDEPVTVKIGDQEYTGGGSDGTATVTSAS